MYYKLPVKQRLEYMNSFRKANPHISYYDMVKDYNETFQKFGNGGTPNLKPVNTYQGGKEQNTIANTNNEEYLKQKFLAQKNAEKDLRIADFLLKTTSYLPGTAGVIGGVANATKNIAEDDYKGALSEIVSTFAPKGELKGAAKIYSFYNDFIKDKPEKSYGTTQFYSDEDIKRILDNKNKSITKQ